MGVYSTALSFQGGGAAGAQTVSGLKNRATEFGMHGNRFRVRSFQGTGCHAIPRFSRVDYRSMGRPQEQIPPPLSSIRVISFKRRASKIAIVIDHGEVKVSTGQLSRPI